MSSSLHGFSTQRSIDDRATGSLHSPLLIVRSGPRAGASWPIEGSDVTIGRSRRADIHIEDPTRLISGRHARIFLRDGRWMIEDLLSTNGTFVDERRVDGATPLIDGSLLTMGLTDTEESTILLFRWRPTAPHAPVLAPTPPARATLAYDGPWGRGQCPIDLEAAARYARRRVDDALVALGKVALAGPLDRVLPRLPEDLAARVRAWDRRFRETATAVAEALLQGGGETFDEDPAREKVRSAQRELERVEARRRSLAE